MGLLAGSHAAFQQKTVSVEDFRKIKGEWWFPADFLNVTHHTVSGFETCKHAEALNSPTFKLNHSINAIFNIFERPPFPPWEVFFITKAAIPECENASWIQLCWVPNAEQRIQKNWVCFPKPA